ncbi:MAG TPA: hypothetical protein VIP79_07200 [Gemmatimonadaceae bacterium]
MKFARSSWSLALLSVFAAPAMVAAQSAKPLSPGMRVRVTVATLPRAKGIVVESSDRAFRFAPEKSADTITVEYANVVQLDVSRGMHNRTAHDAIWGAGMGAALGAVVGAASSAGTEARYAYYDDTVKTGCSVVNPGCPARLPKRLHPPFLNRTMTGLGIGALAGAALGALYGHLRKSEIWERVPPESYRVHVALFPESTRGIGVQLSIAM